MKTILKKLIPAVLLLVGTSAFAQYRIATVDLGRVFTNYWKTKEAQTAIDDHKADIEKTGKEMLDTYNKANEDYRKMLVGINDQAVSPEEREKRKKAAEDKLKDIKDQKDGLEQFDRGSRAAMEDQIKRTRDKIVNDIRDVVNAKAKEGNYTMVIDTAAQSVNLTPVVLYAAPGDADLTAAVIKQLNVGARASTPAMDENTDSKTDSKAGKK